MEPGPSESVLRAEIVGLDQGTMCESKQQESKRALDGLQRL